MRDCGFGVGASCLRFRRRCACGRRDVGTASGSARRAFCRPVSSSGGNATRSALICNRLHSDGTPLGQTGSRPIRLGSAAEPSLLRQKRSQLEAHRRSMPEPGATLTGPFSRPAGSGFKSRGFLTKRLVPRSARLGDRNGNLANPSTATQHPASSSVRALHEHAQSHRPGADGRGVCAYGTSPDWPALLVGLLGLAVTLSADARYLRRAIARGHFSFLIERAILVAALALMAAIWLWS